MSGKNKRGKAVRGFVRGILWGGVVAFGGLAVVSQLAGPPSPEVTTAPVAANTNAPEAANTDAPLIAMTDAPVAAPDPAPAASDSDSAPPLAVTDAPAAPDAPASAATAPVLPTPGEAPAAQSQAALPDVSSSDSPVAMAPAPAEPPVAPPSELPLTEMASAGQVSPPNPPVAGESAPQAAQPVVPDAPATDGAPLPADLPPPPPLTPEEEALLRPVPEATPVPDALPEPQPADPTPEPGPMPEPEADLAAVPRPGLDDLAEGVVTGRLPRIGDAAPAEPDAMADAAVPDLLDPALDDSLPPLLRFARPFENTAQKPLFAIILVDKAQEGVNRAELAALDLALTIVVDPLSEGAAERAAIWRAGGQEVVMAGSGIPEGASPGDLEQSFQVLAERLPEAVAVIDTDGTAFQNNRPLASQVVPILAEQGRGLITFDQGLNAADQVAQRENLPATTIFRQIDGEGEDAPVIRRYLDRAAFKAAQEGRVAVIGDLRPETVAGVLEWAVEGRASTVAIAPISALLGN